MERVLLRTEAAYLPSLEALMTIRGARRLRLHLLRFNIDTFVLGLGSFEDNLDDCAFVFTSAQAYVRNILRFCFRIGLPVAVLLLLDILHRRNVAGSLPGTYVFATGLALTRFFSFQLYFDRL